MKITSSGYPIKFIQTHPVSPFDATCHIRSYVYKFTSTKTNFHYIVRAELHENDFFAIKFYAKRHRKSESKYQKVVNTRDVAGVIVTAAKVIPVILEDFPKASFGFFGSRTFDKKSKRLEPVTNNQRFRLYEYHIPQLIGDKTFTHYKYKKGSAYALINNLVNNIDKHEKLIRTKLVYDYPDLTAINS